MPIVTRGTRNVFADLGYPDAGVRQARLRLAMALNQLLDRQLPSNLGAAKNPGLSPAEVSDLRNYRLAKVSMMRMLSIFVALGHDVDVVVRRSGMGRIKILCEGSVSKRPASLRQLQSHGSAPSGSRSRQG